MEKVIFISLLMCLCTLNIVFAENGVSDKEIILGQSCAMAGPAKALGIGMKKGMAAYFAQINDAGGVKGRKIKLITLDDGYEPEKAIKNTRKLIEKEKVFALIGEVGTPTSKAVVPIAEKAKVPFFGPFTGAEFLRKPFKKYVVNVRGSYYQEMEKLAQYLVDTKKMKKIACFYQNDDYGQAGLSGIQLALKKREMELIETGNYERNTIAVKSSLLKIRRAKPEAVVMVGAYKPCSEFIKLARKVKMTDTVFCNISFVGTEALKKALGDTGEGCIISQVVSYPWDQNIPLVKEYTAAMKKFNSKLDVGFVTLEGYMVAKLFCMTLEAVKGDLNRENFLKAISEQGKFDLGGVILKYGPDDHQGMDKVFLTIISGQDIIPLKN